MKAESEIDAPTSQGLPRCLSGNESASNAGDARDAGLMPGSGRSPGGGNGNPLQYSCRIDWFDLLAVQRTLKSLFQHDSSKASFLWFSAFFIV